MTHYKKFIVALSMIITVNAQNVEAKQVALVTGVSRGIGYALTQNLLNRGIQVIGIARSDVSAVQELVADPNFIYISADLATPEGIETVRTYIKTHQYSFDFIVHNAAIMMPPQTIETMDLETMEKVIQVNLLAPMKLSKIVITHCNINARILNINSCASIIPFPQVAPYCIAKAGLTMFTNVLRQELQNRSIAVASVIPGDVDTEMQRILRETREFNLAEKLYENYNTGQLIAPNICAQFLSWLLCDTSFDDFNNALTQWDIYDQSHHAHWLRGDLPAFPG